MSHHDRPGEEHAADTSHRVEQLQTDECWRLLQGASLARLALLDADGAPEIYPINIQVVHGAVLIRSSYDAKARALAARPRFALETDGGTLRVRWSVIAHGTAEVTANDIDDAPAAGGGSWYPGEKSHVIRLTVEDLTGKRFLVPVTARTEGADQAPSS